jgi:hypothetical protein
MSGAAKHLICPSCDIAVEGRVCPTCGARYRAGGWRYVTKIRCRVCKHLSRPLIENSLAQRTSLRDVATRFGVSRSALSRHQRRHMVAQNAAGNAKSNVPRQSNNSLGKIGLGHAPLTSRFAVECLAL